MHVSVAEELLTSFNLRHTQQRVLILTTFLNAKHALSHNDLESAFEGQIDRATIYRCLKQFLDAGILHRIPDEQFQTKYAVCNTCDHQEHHHDHVHFNCRKCNLTQCIEHSEIPEIKLPAGFVGEERILIVQGLCRNCVG